MTTNTQGWQPIKTAPKDGTEILMGEFNEGNGRFEQTVGFWNENRNAEWYGTSWEASEYSAFDQNPTHWMPLPKEPKRENYDN